MSARLGVSVCVRVGRQLFVLFVRRCGSGGRGGQRTGEKRAGLQGRNFDLLYKFAVDKTGGQCMDGRSPGERRRAHVCPLQAPR